MNALIDMGAFFHDKKMTSKKGRQTLSNSPWRICAQIFWASSKDSLKKLWHSPKASAECS